MAIIQARQEPVATGVTTAEEVLESGWRTNLSETVAQCLMLRSNETILALLNKLARMVERKKSDVSSGLSDVEEAAVVSKD